MADVRNHLLSFSVLALLNAHSPGAIAQSVIPLCTQKITLDDLTGEEGFFVFKEFLSSADATRTCGNDIKAEKLKCN